MDKIEKLVLQQQKAEITEHNIYKKLAKKAKDPHNKKILTHISEDELRHHDYWKSITKKDIKPDKRKIRRYSVLASLFGLSFALRLMEKNEEGAQNTYEIIAKKYPQALKIKYEEEKHEEKLIGLLNDEKLSYAGAIVLGLNDALVELTGTLAGLSFAFGNTLIIGMTGIIMGIAASMSMAASGYLSSKEDEVEEQNPIKSAIYTGLAYIITVIFLVAPYFIFDEVFTALTAMLITTIIIIALYTYYISVAKNVKFKTRFLSMAAISLGVALISFLRGYAVKTFLGIDI